MLNLKSQGLIGLLAVIVLLQDVQADSKETYLDRIETDKKQVENYIGLAGLELAEGNLKAALKAQKRGLRYAKQNDDKLALRTLGIQIESCLLYTSPSPRDPL